MLWLEHSIFFFYIEWGVYHGPELFLLYPSRTAIHACSLTTGKPHLQTLGMQTTTTHRLTHRQAYRENINAEINFRGTRDSRDIVVKHFRVVKNSVVPQSGKGHEVSYLFLPIVYCWRKDVYQPFFQQSKPVGKPYQSVSNHNYDVTTPTTMTSLTLLLRRP